jgi:hypothetical protein
LRQIVGTGAQESYGEAIAGVWTELLRTLARLEVLAMQPAETLPHEQLTSLQYALHRTAESLTELDPPAGAQLEHDELATATGDARDATGEIADALQAGDLDAVESFVYEWRGALFRVRLARLRLSRPGQTVEAASPAPELSARQGWALAAAGALVLAAGALAGMWLLAGLGLTALAAGALTGLR